MLNGSNADKLLAHLLALPPIGVVAGVETGALVANRYHVLRFLDVVHVQNLRRLRHQMKKLLARIVIVAFWGIPVVLIFVHGFSIGAYGHSLVSDIGFVGVLLSYPLLLLPAYNWAKRQLK